MQNAILFVARASIRPLLRQQLKSAGVNDVQTAESAEDCVDQLRRRADAMLVLDWENGSQNVNLVLRAARGQWGIDTRPIFLIAGEVSLDIVAIGTEYHVARIHTGEVSKGVIEEHIAHIVDEESQTSGYRATLTRIAVSRAAGDHAASGRELMDLHKQYPENRRITCELADNMIHEDRWGEALAVLEQLSLTDRHNLRVQHLMARCLMKESRFEDAANLLLKGKIINPHNPERLVDLGQALLQTGRVREALTNFKEALDIDASLVEARYGTAQCHLVEGDVNEALSLMKQVSGPRELASVFNSAAILCVRQQRVDDGLELYKTAIATIGNGSDGGGVLARLFYNLGLAYHRLQRDKEALRCFERATQYDRHFEKSRHNVEVLSSILSRAEQLQQAPQDSEGNLGDAEDFDEENFKSARGAA